MTPDGIMSFLPGPVEGSVGDWTLWHQSGIEDFLRSLFSETPTLERLYCGLLILIVMVYSMENRLLLHFF